MSPKLNGKLRLMIASTLVLVGPRDPVALGVRGTVGILPARLPGAPASVMCAEGTLGVALVAGRQAPRRNARLAPALRPPRP